jgi:hypothetical protein
MTMFVAPRHQALPAYEEVTSRLGDLEPFDVNELTVLGRGFFHAQLNVETRASHRPSLVERVGRRRSKRHADSLGHRPRRI